MKAYKPHIHDYGYRLCATDEIREALKSLGIDHAALAINRGCHWGDVWFFDNDLKCIKSLMDPKDRHLRIDTETRYFYLSPYGLETGSHWQFSVESNKPKEYKPRIRKKRGPYHK